MVFPTTSCSLAKMGFAACYGGQSGAWDEKGKIFSLTPPYPNSWRKSEETNGLRQLLLEGDR